MTGPRATQIQHIQSRLIHGLKPVRPLAPFRYLMLVCIAAFVTPVFICAVYLGGSGWHAQSSVQRIAVFGALALCTVILSLLMVGQMAPASRPALPPALLLCLVPVMLVISIAFSFHNPDQPPFTAADFACLRKGLLYSLPAALLFWLLVRRGAVLSPQLAGAITGGLAGLNGFCILECTCPIVASPHIFLWHLSLVFVVAFAGLLIGSAVYHLEQR